MSCARWEIFVESLCYKTENLLRGETRKTQFTGDRNLGTRLRWVPKQKLDA